MLAHESTYCVAVPGGSAEVSLPELRTILRQVEAELHQSEVYGQMLSNLQALPEELTRQVQSLVRAVGREAIRLSLRKLVRRKPSVIAPAAPSASAMPRVAPRLLQPPAPPPNAHLNEVPADADRASLAIAAVSPPASQTTHLLNGRVTLYPSTAASKTGQFHTNPYRKPSKKELAVQAVQQAREACLQEMGQVIRQVRQDKNWSPYLLHIKTQIPIYQLEALEMGRIDRLPEDIYLRGFIRQVGNALGLDGNQMAASLPAMDAATAVLPSWQKPNVYSGLRFSSMHAYLGYAALMAGGIALVSHQSAPPQAHLTPAPPPATVVPSPKATSASPASVNANQKATAALNSKQGTVTPGNMSPPERSPL